MQPQNSPAVLPERRLVFECAASDGFRTSPLVFVAGSADVLGLDAASHQLAEHTLLAHGGDAGVGFVSVDMPGEAQ